MKLKHIVALATAAFVLPLHAAELSAQKGISILLVNGQTAQEKVGTNQVTDGFTQAVVKMDGKIGHGASAEIYESKPYVLNFDAKGSDIEVKLPRFNSAAQAKQAFDSQKPGWKVLVDGKSVDVEYNLLPGKKGFMPYIGMEDLVAEHNKQRGIYFKQGQLIDAPVAVEVAAVTTSSSVSSTSSVTSSAVVAEAPKVATKNVEQLKAWYLQASKEERKEFRRWMIDQE